MLVCSHNKLIKDYLGCILLSSLIPVGARGKFEQLILCSIYSVVYN